jgi:tryptophanyl-tRNA synthetase
LKRDLTTALNDALAGIRKRRAELANDAALVVKNTLRRGVGEANQRAERTLAEMRAAMNMDYGL